MLAIDPPRPQETNVLAQDSAEVPLGPCYTVGVTPEQIVDQFQQVIGTLKRTIEASAAVADRVESLERNSGETVGLLTALQGNVQVLLDTYQAQAQAQNELLMEAVNRIAQLEARLAALEGPSSGSVH